MGTGVLTGSQLARTGFPVIGLSFLAFALILGGLLLLRSGMVRRGS